MRLEIMPFKKILREFPEIHEELMNDTNFRLHVRAIEMGTVGQLRYNAKSVIRKFNVLSQ